MGQALTWSGGKAYEYVDGALQEVQTPQTYTMPDGTRYTYNSDGIAQALPQGQTTAAPVYQGSAQGIPQWLIDANKGQNISDGAVALGGTNGYSVGNQVYSTTQWNGEGPAPWSGGANVPNIYNYENTPAVQSAGNTGLLSQLNGTPYNTLDANGNLTGTGTWSNIKDDHSAGMDNLVTALVGGIFGAGALGYLGGAGAAAEGAGVGAAGAGATGAGTGAGVTGFGDAGLMYGGASADAAGSLGGGASIAGGAAGGGLAGATSVGSGAYTTAAADSQLASTQLGITGDMAGADAAGAAIPSVTVNGATSGGSSLATGAAGGGLGLGSISGSQVAGIAGSLLGGSGGGGSTGTNTGGLGSYIPGLVDAYTQGQASDKMLAWLNGQQAKIDGLYAPGSPEYNYLWDSMSRKDAAAGRNSQYGPRSVDLAARIADTKAQYTSRLATALAGNYSSAFNQDATKYSGLLGALGNNSGNNNLVNSLLRLYNGGAGTTSTGGNAGGYGYGMNDSSLGNINLDEWWA